MKTYIERNSYARVPSFAVLELENSREWELICMAIRSFISNTENSVRSVFDLANYKGGILQFCDDELFAVREKIDDLEVLNGLSQSLSVSSGLPFSCFDLERVKVRASE